MKRSYYPREMQTSTVTETIDAECPFCKGHATEAVGLVEGNPDYTKYFCYECQVKFVKHEPIPFLRRQTC